MMETLQKSEVFFDRFDRKPAQPETTHYCPGCGHGILHKLLAEALRDLGVQDRAILVAPVGCSVFLYYYFRCACVSAPHGRAPAVATGLGRSHPEAVVISYQGDGDLAAIGTNNIIHAANRGENMLVLFVNNNTYGMTGGQLAPTTLVGQRTTTSPHGRDEINDGPPLKMAEIMATLGGPAYVARVALSSPARIMQTRKVLRKALSLQVERKGFAFVEVLSACPTNWHLTPVQACEWIENTVVPQFPLGEIKDISRRRHPVIRTLKSAAYEDVLRVLGQEGSAPDHPPRAELPAPEVRFKAAGFGGQGVLSMGLILSQAALHAGLEVTWLPSYGPEMRGGVANCGVVVAERPVASPVVDTPDMLVAMNAPSLRKFGPKVPPGGCVVYNRSMIAEPPGDIRARCLGVNATEIAEELGNVRYASVVALGYLAGITGLLGMRWIERGLRDVFPSDKIYHGNVTAALRGWQMAENAERA